MKRVLLVEDDLIISRIYQGLLRKAGCEVIAAGDGEMALQALSQGQPDLVLLDLMLPKINGVEVLKHIRSTASIRDVPVIVFTNASMGALLDEAMRIGATQFVIKAQTTPKQMVEIVQGYLSTGSSTSTAAQAGTLCSLTPS